jgi:hypothetical protein
MTRQFRPPQPIRARSGLDGSPLLVVYGGRARTVTQVVARWRTPLAWWRQSTLSASSLAHPEREHFRLVTDGSQICEVVRDGEAWYLERLVD